MQDQDNTQTIVAKTHETDFIPIMSNILVCILFYNKYLRLAVCPSKVVSLLVEILVDGVKRLFVN